MSWIQRVETVLDVLKGSSIGEIELTEGALEITVRRNPGTLVAVQPQARARGGAAVADGPAQASHTLEMKSPLSGVYYSAPSPTSPPLIQVGDSVKVGQVVALVEAMKVFSEIPSEVSGRVITIKAQSGDVLKKGDVLFIVEPL